MNNYLPTDYQSFIHTSRYARWLEDENRRETWSETVERYISNVVRPVVNSKVANEIRDAILSLDVMPSMRTMMTAGKAADRDNTCMYNCSYLPIDDQKAFDEAMFILLCGTGVGFSCERQYISKLPEVPDQLFDSDMTIIVKDSKEGWAKAYRLLISTLYSGEIPKWDVSKVRPAGARLKTFGGRASGPAPLEELFNFTIQVFKNAKGRKLSSIECHDIMCKVGNIVVVGGVRRSAMISLSNLSDDRMRHAKSGEWWDDPENNIFRQGYRSMANNSVAYTEKPDAISFLREWTALAESGSGERGIFNRQAATKQVSKNGRRDPNYEWGTNPCSEIILRGPKIDSKTGEPIVGTGGQFCNLSEVVVRATDSKADLVRKIKLATILGTIQSTYTKFPYLRKIWKKNTEEERLLGVSLTGVMDNTLTNGKEDGLEFLLQDLQKTAIVTNAKYAQMLGIPVSKAITCLKPSGTCSQLVDSASGIHARHNDYYIRTVRGDNKDPLTEFMKAQGVPHEKCVQKPETTTVFSFPVASPVGSITRSQMTAIEQLKMWLIYQDYFCEHKPSCTISVKNDEWFEVGAFVYEHFDKMSGVSFLPHSEHVYQQAPYQDITEEEYKAALKKMPRKIDWAALSEYEKEDTTKSSQTLACTGDVCEVVDISA